MTDPVFTGQRQLRAEDPRLLTGRGQYVADVALPGMLEVAFVRSTMAHARIDAISYDFAIGLDGVETVFVAEDLPDTSMVSKRHPKLLLTPQPPLAVGKVRFVGEAVAMVLADSRYVAEDAADMVNVTYTDLSAAGPGATAEPLFADIPDDVVFRDSQSYGQPDEAFNDAAIVIKRSLALARQSACPLEPRGCVADYDPATSQLTLYASTQAPHRLRRDVAGALRIPENHVRVVMHDIGGAFGQKIPTHLEDIAVAAAAMLAGRPVRWIEDRQENLISAPHSRGQELMLELALDESHLFTAFRASIRGDSGAYSFNSASCLTEAYRSARALPGPYDVANYAYEVEIKLTSRSPIAPYRGVGFVAAQAARELLIDEAARQIGEDRFALRRRNLVAQEKLPYTSCTGWVYNEGSFTATLDRAEHILRNPPAGKAARPSAGRLTGVGISPYVEPSGTGGEGGMQVHGFASPSHDSARVAVDSSGKATVSFGTPSLGQGLETTMAQLAADALGLDIRDVSVAWTDTSQAPMSLTGTRASRAAVVTGGAVARAARDVRAQILEVAATMREISPSSLEINRGDIRIAGEDAVQLTVADAVRAGFFDDTLRDPGRQRTFEATRLYDPPATYSNACVVAVVDVDPDTGGVEVKRIIGVEDCGVMINPMIVSGQFIGAVAQAIGAALFERVHYSAEEQPTASTLMDYLLPTALETVRVELSHIETPTELTEGGLKGMGESGMIGTVAAIASAVDDALGSAGGGSVRRLPLLPEEVWTQLRQQQS